MKKSTLITTIAMIVVVVVALSTATYAWFSSQTTAVATTNFTTNASGDWSMMIGTVAADGSLTFSGNAVDSETLDPTPIQAGLWAPTATINTAISSSEAATSLTSRAGFVQADKAGDVYNIKKLQTGKFDSSLATPAAGIGYAAPHAIRVMNVSGEQKRLQLNITLNAHDDGTSNSMYAAAALRFYVYEITNANDNNTASYTSGYFPINETEAVNNATSITGTITKATAVPMTPNLQGSYLGKNDQEEDAILTRSVSLADYKVGNIATQFPAAGGNNPNLGITAGDHVKTYSFDMQTYGIGGFSNIIIYAWIDGWVANGSAQSADFDVNFGFTSVPTLTANNG